jgi:ribosomal protein S18 acetylase RimI-like enzyme
VLTIRQATRADERRLAELDRTTWSFDVAPVPLWPAETNFFASDDPADVFVAQRADVVLGYVKLRRPTLLESNRHVLQIGGLAVDPAAVRQGIGKALMAAAVEEASRRGARRLTLHVLGTNLPARALYESCGFTIEGVRPEEFMLNGCLIDDVLMGRHLTRPDADAS